MYVREAQLAWLYNYSSLELLGVLIMKGLSSGMKGPKKFLGLTFLDAETAIIAIVNQPCCSITPKFKVTFWQVVGIQGVAVSHVCLTLES